MNDAPPLLHIRGVAKTFGAVRALRSADLEVRPGEAHALMGANGAGKSTLVKIITGVFPADEGEMVLAGQPVAFRSPAEARRAGIVSVYQDPAIVPDLTVAQNMRLARVSLDKVRTAMRELGVERVDLATVARDVDFAASAADRSRARARVRPAHSDAGRDHRRAAGGPLRARVQGRAGFSRAGRERDLHLAPHGRDRHALRPGDGAARRGHRRRHADQGRRRDDRQPDAGLGRGQGDGGAGRAPGPSRGGARDAGARSHGPCLRTRPAWRLLPRQSRRSARRRRSRRARPGGAVRLHRGRQARRRRRGAGGRARPQAAPSRGRDPRRPGAGPGQPAGLAAAAALGAGERGAGGVWPVAQLGAHCDRRGAAPGRRCGAQSCRSTPAPLRK